MSRYVCYSCTFFYIQLRHSSKVLFLTLMELPSTLCRAVTDTPIPYAPPSNLWTPIHPLQKLCSPVNHIRPCASFSPVLHLLHPYAPISSVYTLYPIIPLYPHASSAPFWLAKVLQHSQSEGVYIPATFT